MKQSILLRNLYTNFLFTHMGCMLDRALVPGEIIILQIGYHWSQQYLLVCHQKRVVK